MIHWKRKSSLGLLFLFFLLCQGQAQDYFRFRADFSLKEISTFSDSLERRLIIGTCFFDKNLNKLTYDLTFPHPEKWIMEDSFIYTLREGRLIDKAPVPPITEHNIFKMLLDQTFSEFGMMKSGYEIKQVRKVDGQVYMTYSPPDEYADVLGSLVLVKEGKLLKGAIYYEPDGNMMFRQQLDDYQIMDGLPIPTSMSHVIEKSDKQIKRILTFENIVINETGQEALYDPVVLDAHRQ